MDEETVQDLKRKLETLMDRQKPFLNSNYFMGDLCHDMNIPVYKLRIFLNQEIGMNFNDYINKRRVEYCLKMLKTGDWQKFTVQAMAEECGFNNRNSFTQAFKKFLGMTPATYLRKLKNE